VALWLFGVRNYTPPGAAWSEDSAFHGASVAEQRKATGLAARRNAESYCWGKLSGLCCRSPQRC